MQVPYVLKNKWVQTTIISASTFAVGYILGKRNGDVFEVYVDEETLSDLIDDNQLKLPLDDFSEYVTETPIEEVLLPVFVTPERAVKYDYSNLDNDVEIEEVLEPVILQTDPVVLVTTQSVKKVNVFDRTPDVWDEEVELAHRTKNTSTPYILHADEYILNERDYKQETVTYYEGDDIMADEVETPIYNHEKSMGELRFGHGSLDENVVYIRNDALRREWEVLRHHGRFEIEVLGHDVEDQYSELDKRSSADRKFRDD